MMTQTAHEVGAHLGRDLAGLVVRHVAARDRDALSVGLAGEVEGVTVTEKYLGGCARGGHVALIARARPKSAELGHVMFQACQFNQLCVVQYALAKGATNVDEVFKIACPMGRARIADLLAARGLVSVNDGLDMACAAGQLEVAHRMLALGATGVQVGLLTACHFGHMQLAMLMIDHGAKNIVSAKRYAQLGGHAKLLEFLANLPQE
jgi:hypothetical protein